MDGKEISENKIKQVSTYDIKSINILKGEIAIKNYGGKGKYGVIEVTTK